MSSTTWAPTRFPGPANAKTGSYVASGPYRVPNRRLTTYAVYTNLPPAGPYRGVGVPHVAWAYESEMDRIARHLGMDPVELRLKNLLQEGDLFVTGESLVSVGISDCLRQVASGVGWRGREEQQNGVREGSLRRGKGLAVIMKSTTTPTASAASVRLNGDGLGDAPHQQHGDGPGSAHLSGADRGGPARHAGGAGHGVRPGHRRDPLRQVHQLQPYHLPHGQRRAASGRGGARATARGRRPGAGGGQGRPGARRRRGAGQGGARPGPDRAAVACG